MYESFQLKKKKAKKSIDVFKKKELNPGFQSFRNKKTTRIRVVKVSFITNSV